MQTVKISIVPNKAFYKTSPLEDQVLQEVVVLSKPKKTEEKRKLRHLNLNEKNTFAFLNYYNYTNFQYLNAHCEHHFNGFVMYCLPLIKN